MNRLLDALLEHDSVRYVAIHEEGRLTVRSKSGRTGASTAESDKYEELIVNPTLLKLLGQRGEIDCGGLEHVAVRYGNFFQVVVPTPDGHISVSVEVLGDPEAVAVQVKEALAAESLST